MVLADRMIGTEFSSGARAAEHLLDICCVVCWSQQLWKETITAVHQRKALPIPWAFVPVWQRLVRVEKLLKIPRSKLEVIKLPDRPARRIHEADPYDVHLLPLALAAGARWLVTRDSKLLGAAADLAETLTIVAPEWVIDEPQSSHGS